MASEIPTGFDQEAWDWIVADARAKLAWAKGNRPKRPIALTRRIAETRRRNLKTKQKERMKELEKISIEGWETWLGRHRAKGFARLHILAAMEPGHWYARSDITAASGIHRKTVNGTTERMERNGLLQRARNPDYLPMCVQERLAHPERIESQWLWSLTDSGCTARKGALQELEALGRPEIADKKEPALDVL